jgi:hypothetical protein
MIGNIEKNMKKNTIYHSTSFSRAQKILKEGLKPNSYGYVALAEKQRYSIYFGMQRAEIEGDAFAVCFAVGLPFHKLNEPDPVKHVMCPGKSKCWRYRDGRIAPSFIKVAKIIKINDRMPFSFRSLRPERKEWREKMALLRSSS